MFLGNIAIQELIKSGSIVYSGLSGNFDGDDFGVDLHLDKHFWIMRHGAIIDIRTNDPDYTYSYHNAEHDKSITLLPLSVTLATTVETLGSCIPSVAAILHTRSTYARYGLALDASSNIIAPGFVSKLTLELINNTREYITIPIGAHIGTAYFVEVRDNDYLYDGAYSGQWTPEMMLPRGTK